MTKSITKEKPTPKEQYYTKPPLWDLREAVIILLQAGLVSAALVFLVIGVFNLMGLL